MKYISTLFIYFGLAVFVVVAAPTTPGQEFVLCKWPTCLDFIPSSTLEDHLVKHQQEERRLRGELPPPTPDHPRQHQRSSHSAYDGAHVQPKTDVSAYPQTSSTRRPAGSNRYPTGGDGPGLGLTPILPRPHGVPHSRHPVPQAVVHDESKPFRCELLNVDKHTCNRKFVDKKQLRAHQRHGVHHPSEKPFICPKCEEGFRNVHDFNNHSSNCPKIKGNRIRDGNLPPPTPDHPRQHQGSSHSAYDGAHVQPKTDVSAYPQTSSTRRPAGSNRYPTGGDGPGLGLTPILPQPHGGLGLTPILPRPDGVPHGRHPMPQAVVHEKPKIRCNLLTVDENECGRGFATKSNLGRHQRHDAHYSKSFICHKCGEGFGKKLDFNHHSTTC